MTDAPVSSLPPPRRRGRLRRRIIAAMAVVIVAIIVTYWLGKAWLVRNRAIALLESMGLQVADLRITDATPWHAQIEGLVAGPNSEVRVQKISIHYSPTRLFRHRVDRIVISGADLNARLLDLVHIASGEDSQDDTAPLSTLQLIDSKIHVGPQEDEIVLPIQGELTSNEGAYHITAEADVKPQPVKLSAVVHGGDVAGSIDSGALETDIVTRLLRAFNINAPQMTGWTETRISVARQKDGASVSVTLHPDAVTFITAAGDKYNIEHGSIEYTQGFGASPSDAIVKLTGVNASSSSSAIFAEGIDGSMTIQHFWPLLTPAAQQISIAKMTSGKVKLSDGSLKFHGESSGDIVIDHLQFAGMDGSVTSDNARISGVDGSASFTIAANDLSLHDLLDAFASGKATGDGRVNATVPMQIHGGLIALGEGSAVATPGGNIQIIDAKSLTDSIASADPSFAPGGANAQLRDDLPRSLADFQFQTLRADLQNGENGLRADVHVVGRGRVTQTRPYDLEFRIAPVNDAIAIGLGVQKVLQGR